MVFFLSCKENETINMDDVIMKAQVKRIIADENTRKDLNDSIDKVIATGDSILYHDLLMKFYFYQPNDKFLYPSMVMANKYNSAEGCLYVYMILSESVNGSYVSEDEKTKCIAMYYLLKSNELGNKNAKYEVGEIFKDKKIPKASFYLEKMAKM